MKIREDGESISADTYRALRASILSGAYAPGAKVTTPALCKTFGASPGAVREALSRLRAEGLINAEVHRGFSITPVSVDDLRDLTQVRIDIETNCLARAIKHGQFAWEANLVASAHLLTRAYKGTRTGVDPSPVFVDLHRDFHQALVSACDSPRLLQMRLQLFDEAERYRVMDNAIAHGRDAAEEHRLITEATLARDSRRAQKLLAEHIDNTTTAIIKAMTEQPESVARAAARRQKAAATSRPAGARTASGASSLRSLRAR